MQILKSGPISREISRTSEFDHLNFEVRSRKSELGTRNSELRSQNSEVRSRNSEVGTQKSEVGSRKLEVPPRLSYVAYLKNIQKRSAHNYCRWEPKCIHYTFFFTRLYLTRFAVFSSFPATVCATFAIKGWMPR